MGPGARLKAMPFERAIAMPSAREEAFSDEALVSGLFSRFSGELPVSR
jgi:hypothetical protein